MIEPASNFFVAALAGAAGTTLTDAAVRSPAATETPRSSERMRPGTDRLEATREKRMMRFL